MGDKETTEDFAARLRAQAFGTEALAARLFGQDAGEAGESVPDAIEDDEEEDEHA